VYEESNLFPYSRTVLYLHSVGRLAFTIVSNTFLYNWLALIPLRSFCFISAGIVDILSSLKIASYDERENGNRCHVIMHK
jgi:hypothetical protein